MEKKDGLYTLQELSDILSMSQRDIVQYLDKYDIQPVRKNNRTVYDEKSLKILEIINLIMTSRFFTLNMASYFVDLASQENGPLEILPGEALETQIKILDKVREIRNLKDSDSEPIETDNRMFHYFKVLMKNLGMDGKKSIH